MFCNFYHTFLFNPPELLYPLQYHGDGARGGVSGHHAAGGEQQRVAALCRGAVDRHLGSDAQTPLLHTAP